MLSKIHSYITAFSVINWKTTTLFYHFDVPTTSKQRLVPAGFLFVFFLLKNKGSFVVHYFRQIFFSLIFLFSFVVVLFL